MKFAKYLLTPPRDWRTYSAPKRELAGEHAMTKLISEMTAREVRARWVQVRREGNATARRLGFKNFKEWQGDDAE